jgi:uncharacterized protein YjfI (DUF2170 family)
MREMRERYKAAGLVPRDVWILPENANALRTIEKTLRQPYRGSKVKLEDYMAENMNWTITALHAALIELDAAKNNEIGVSLIQGLEPSLKVTLAEYGDLPIFIAAVGEQIIVDTLLIDADDVKDINAFNDAVLRSRSMFPLSSIGIETMPGGETVYNMFGALSAGSSLTNVVHEIYTLADNVVRATEAYSDYFN